jgi:hypothetical protein
MVNNPFVAKPLDAPVNLQYNCKYAGILLPDKKH